MPTGKIDLDRPINDYLPSAKTSESDVVLQARDKIVILRAGDFFDVFVFPPSNQLYFKSPTKPS